jgi:taurine dioxygenase
VRAEEHFGPTAARKGEVAMHTRPLHDDFGVEVVDFDVHRTATPQQIEQLLEALDEHQLLLFRGGKPITPERQMELCSWFGPLMDSVGGLRCTVLRNEEASGSIKLPFHADFSYSDSPIKVISLHAIRVPPGGTSTSFASGIRGWATLPSDLKDLLTPMTLRHRHLSSVATDWPEFVADHPIRKLHPRTGRPILFVTEHHADRIHELDPERSREVLGRIFAHMYGPSHIYTHRWQLHDFVIWDNLAVQHARLEVADPTEGARAVQRVAVNDVSVPELLARARQQHERRLHTA